MILSLQATNFRRHQELDLRFDDNQQLILISGPNGAGKSTILEAITFALWGEGRHGRRNLDVLVRRGAELEGMSVELTFTVGKDTYRVHRRRDGKAVTAVLYANDMPVVEGTNAVTGEISALLGMDAAGFRLAVIAQQKDLDGLASLRPAERAAMISRLLRLDVVGAARAEAMARFRNERTIAQELRGGDIVSRTTDLAAAEETLQAAEHELNAAAAAAKRLKDELQVSQNVDASWEESLLEVARLEGALEQLVRHQDDLTAQAAALVVPEVTVAAVDMIEVAALTADIERSLTLADQAAQNERTRELVSSELDAVTARREEIEARLLLISAATVDELAATLAAGEIEVRQAEETVQGHRDQLTGLTSRRQQTSARLDEHEGLGSSCDRCGQDIDQAHRQAQRDRLSSELEKIDEEIEAVKVLGRSASDRLNGLRADLSARRTALEQARADRAEKDRISSERDELLRRARTYAAQLERLTVEKFDVPALRHRKQELSDLAKVAALHAEQLRTRNGALARRDEISSAMANLAKEIGNIESRLTAARPDELLVESFEHRQALKARLEVELELVNHWRSEVAAAQARQTAAKDALGAAEELETRRRGHQDRAVAAAAAARLLGDVAEQLAVSIRPALEGAVSVLLSTMSDGRFNKVTISDEYAISVEDDGKFRPLSELSGGEVDLVALAVRLALAQVVADRHGAGGAGFLILDECFASQDQHRRQSILNALRNLRDVYSQIFLISHVENIEDSADMVVSVNPLADRSGTEVIVS